MDHGAVTADGSALVLADMTSGDAPAVVIGLRQ